MITIHRIKQGTPEWDQIREGLYTGTSAEKLLSAARARKIINGKITPYALNELSTFGGNYHTKRGHILEDEALELYELIYKVTVDRPGFITNSKYPMCGYSPDGIEGDYLLEVKCFMKDKHMAMFNGDIPLKVLAQIHFGMLISGKKKARLIIYNPELEAEYALKVIDIKYNRNIIINIRGLLTKGASA